MTTGPKSPGTAAEASNAGTRGPCSNQVALAVSMHEATHPKGVGRSSMWVDASSATESSDSS
jgi:hypothetical protein